jgi:hypothetical protein
LICGSFQPGEIPITRRAGAGEKRVTPMEAVKRQSLQGVH